MGLFDEFVGGKPPSEDELRPRQPSSTIAAPSGSGPGLFQEFVGGAPSAPAPLAPSGRPVASGQPFGELRAPDPPSWTEWLKQKGQDALIGLGAEPYKARKLSEGLVGVAGITPMGSVLSAADLTYDLPRGNLGHAAFDALGAVPGVTAARRLVQGMPMRSLATVPTSDELKTAAKTGYDAVRNAPVTYAPEAMDDVANIVRTNLTRSGLNPEKAPSTFATLDRASAPRNIPPGARAVVTPDDFDTLRQTLRSGVPQTQDSLAGGLAIEHLDRYLASPPAGRVIQGAPADLDALRQNLAQARGDYHIKKLSDAVEGRLDKAEVSAQAAHSGLNIDNTTRQWLKGLITTKAGERSIAAATDAEKQAIRNTIAGDLVTNQLRRWGNRLGGGGGIGQGGIYAGGHALGQAGAHAMGLDPITAFSVGVGTGTATVGAGQAMRSAANARTTARAADIGEMMRMRSPEYRARVAAENARGGPLIDPAAMSRDAITYALTPQAANAGKDWLDNQFVPYANR